MDIKKMTNSSLLSNIKQMYKEIDTRESEDALTTKIIVLETMERECIKERSEFISRGQFHWQQWHEGTQAIIEDNLEVGANHQHSNDGRYLLTINTMQLDGRLESLEWIDGNSLTALIHIGEIYLHGSFSQTLNQIKYTEGYGE